jgi:hypothetical protein
MSQGKGIVDNKAEESFPRIGLDERPIAKKVVAVGGLLVVHVENGRGEELCQHLASHGINALASPMAETPFERIEIDGNADAEVVQTIFDEWED